MSKKAEYKESNEAFMTEKSMCASVGKLPGGVLYEVLNCGNAVGSVTRRSVVVCHYRGELLDGTVFDDSWSRGCPEAFRVNELIEGFQTALCAMHPGDRWRVYIPWQVGYGKRSGGGIPAFSTLVFEIELLNIA